MRKYKVFKMVQVDWQCEKCNKANIEYTGWQQKKDGMTYYKHRCPNCKKIMMTMRIFPYLEHVYAIPKDVKKKLKLRNNA